MADGGKAQQGLVADCRDHQPGHQPLCLNWAGCDMFGSDLLDLDAVDSELLDHELLNGDSPKDAKGDLFGDISIITRQPPGGRRVSWGRVEAAYRLKPRNVPGNTLVGSPRTKSPEYPPTLLELEVQALAKIGVVKLYHDSRDLEREVAKAEEEQKRAVINRFNRERQALSPVPGQRLQPVEMGHSSGGSDLLELQKVALLSMKGTKTSSDVASTLSPIPLAGGSDLLELQKVALSSMNRAAQPSAAPPPNAEGAPKTAQRSGPTACFPANVGGDLLELQKVALAKVKKLSGVLEWHTPIPVSGPPQSTAGRDSVKLQHSNRPNNMQEQPNKPSVSTVSPTLPTTTSTTSSKQDGGCDLSEVQKVALRSLRSISKSLTSAMAPGQAKGGGDSLELQKVAWKNVLTASQGGATATPAVGTQPSGGGDLLERPEVANQATSCSAPLQNLRKRNLPSIPSQASPAKIGRGGEAENLLELQKEAPTRMSYGKERGEQVAVEDKEGMRQFDREGGGGTSSSPPRVFHNMPHRETVETLLQELYSKDKALQDASRTIVKKDQLLHEYEASLANAVNLLQCMNVQCTDAKEETAKVLTEAEEIFGNLREACSAFELFDSSVPQCTHSLEGPSTTAPDNIHVLSGSEHGLDTEQVEVDEHRALVEELLRELGNVEVARKEAQQGFELQIQRNEQLIAELQQLDVAALVVEGATCDGSENSSDQGRGNQSDHAVESASDPAKPDLCDQAYKDPVDQAKEHLSDHADETPSDQPKGDLPVYETPSDHDIIKEHLSHQANEIPCEHVYENSLDQVDEDPHDQAKETPANHAYESPSDQAQETQCDHVFEGPEALPDENSYGHGYVQPGVQSNEIQCDHVYENPQHCYDENPCDHSNERPLDQGDQTPCDNSFGETNEQPCDHDFGSSSDVASEFPTEEEGIESTSPSLTVESDKQVLESLQEVESKVSAEIQSFKPTNQRRRPNPVARVSSPNALWDHLLQFVRIQPKAVDVDPDLKSREELQSQLEHRTGEVSLLHKQMKEMRNALLHEQEQRQALAQKAIDIHPWPTRADLEHKEKVIRKMHFQMHQLEAALLQEREEYREALAQKANESGGPQNVDDPALALAAKVDMDNLRASLLSKDEHAREMHEKIARNEIAWQAEKHQMMKSIDDLETKLLVKEEEVIRLTYELETSRSSVYSQRPDELRFKGDYDVHFFHKQVKEDGREILDLRCEVLSLQDCLGIKTQAIKTMEKELARSYSIVTELRSKLRGVQEYERTSQRKGQNTDLLGRLKSTEEKLQRSEKERALMSRKIQDLSARCKYFEEFEHLHREGSDDKKGQAIKELEQELERNVQIIKNMQARCNEYETWAKRAEARNDFDTAGRPSNGGTYDSWKPDLIKLGQLSEEREALAAECDQLRSEMVRYQEENERKGKLLHQLQYDLQNIKRKQIPISPGTYQQNDGEPRSAVVSDDGRPKNANTFNQSTSSVLDLSKVESDDVNTLRELLRAQWRVQKVMEDRLNSMMAYVSDRVNEFEQEPSEATSESSFPATTELNHFHVEAKLMKLQLEQQLQILRGTTFTSLPTSGVASPGQFPQNPVSTQNLQLLVEKNALEDSAQTLQEKTSRLLSRLTSMRTEFNSH